MAKKFNVGEWDEAINLVSKNELKPLYSAVIKAFIENDGIKTIDPPKKSQYKKPYGTKIVIARDHGQDISLGMSDTATLRRYFSDFPHDNLDTKSIEIFANIYAGILNSRINSKEAYNASYSKNSDGLNIIGEERLARDVALSIVQNFSSQVKDLSSKELFSLGQTIAPSNKIQPLTLTIDSKANQRDFDSKFKQIEKNFQGALNKQNMKSRNEDVLPLNKSSSGKENNKQDKTLYTMIGKLLNGLMGKKNTKESSIWYVELPNQFSRSPKYDKVLSELDDKIKRNIKGIVAVTDEKDPKITADKSTYGHKSNPRNKENSR